MNKLKIGNEGEELAIKYLIENEYIILEKNWRFGHKEIDIIAKTTAELVFVEVKTRSNDYFQEPENAVNIKKQKFMIESAQNYIDTYDINLDVRFDIIAITKNKSTFKLKHIKNAFYPNF